MNQLWSQIIPLVPTIITGFWTYHLSRQKSQHQKEQDDVDSWRTLYSEMKKRAEDAETRADKLQAEIDELRKKET
ncbi:hypothetical protein [Lentilactobacillus senioris]|uniref:hypothetical protein n=1 Tax=Lentilactobacillus senioris TaxID=931534 RepID=UPI003D268564